MSVWKTEIQYVQGIYLMSILKFALIKIMRQGNTSHIETIF